MRQRSVAKKYATVLMRIAQNDSEFDKMEAELKSFSGILKASPAAQRFFTTPVVSNAKKLELIHTLCQKVNFLPITQKFLAVLTDRERLDILEDITESLEELKDEKTNTVSVEVITASQLNSDLEERIVSLFTSKLNKNVRLCIKVDPSIIGGMITRVGSTIFDGSIRGQLSRIKERIMRE